LNISENSSNEFEGHEIRYQYL